MNAMTRTELRHRLRDLQKRRTSVALPFDDTSPEAATHRRQKAMNDIFFFAKTYLPHYFTDTTPPFHREWARLGEIRNRLVLVAAPRGHAKSAFFSLLCLLHWATFGARHFIIIGSDTETQGKALLSFVKAEFEENRRLIHDYGPGRGKQSWSDGDIITTGNVRIMARGKGQGMRGLRHGPHRPDAFIGDDLENDAEQRNPDRVAKTVDWIQRVVIPALDPKGWSLIIVGTLLSRRSALFHLMEGRDDTGKPLHISVRYRAIKENGQPLWPARFSKSYLTRLKKEMGAIPFNTEYQNDPRDDEGSLQESWIVDWSKTPDQAAATALVIYTDPSVGASSRHDFKATVAVIQCGRYSDVVAVRIRNESINAMIRGVFDLYEKMTAIYPDARPLVGFEANGFQAVLQSAYEAEEERRHFRLPLRLVRNQSNKILRIESLFSPIERGLLRFCPTDTDQSILIEQLLYLRSGAVHDDGPDALQGAIALLSKPVSHATTCQPLVSSRRRSLPLPHGRRNEFLEEL